ncbi:MAG: hypothetical protein PHW60_06765 [Kiritimatiellae bacterium]|nr:hypothetical protein [Kiritimatiellia bacterium]
MDITKRIQSFSPKETSLNEFGLGDFALKNEIKKALAAPPPAGWKPTGLDRNYYLDLMEVVIKNAKDWIDAQGHVIDPFIKQEFGQTTPRFASPGAILLSFGRIPEIKDMVYRTMDYCCQSLPSGQARTNSPDFWMRELATAYMALETVADQEHIRKWAAGLSAVEPEKIYTNVSPDGNELGKLHNWAIYASGGEAMRQAAGLKPGKDFLWGNAFFDKYVGAQINTCFSGNGMYRDPGDPFTYDVTTRLQIACGLALGYDGKLRAPLEEILRRGGLTALMFISPEGFCPYGGRSAAFNFREAILTALCELEARRYKTSDPGLAGAFKRQSHLSALSVKRWLMDMKPLRHIKNGFEPASLHGIDSYGNYSGYSLLAASFMGLAAVYADDSIAEKPCPAETGGFVFELAPAFHKVFANCQDTYLEIDTAADEYYDATGLGCFAVKGVPLELGLGMPFPRPMKKQGNAAIIIKPPQKQPSEPIAIGPAWQSGEKWVSLAGISCFSHKFKIIKETTQAVQFEVAYTYQKISIVEEYLLERGKVAIKAKVLDGDKSVQAMRFIVPLLVTDGTSKSEIQGPDKGVTKATYLGHTYRIHCDGKTKAELGSDQYANRNAAYRSLVLERAGNEIQVELLLK